MPQASITINAVVGSKLALPINTLVQLDNQNIGGELSYAWEILDQPPLTADVLSSASLQNPTFTPKKEGTYLLKLTVNAGLVTEQSQTVIAAVQQLKTLERIPAAGEVLEADTADGWAVSMDSLLRRIDGLLSDPGIIVGVNASGGALTRGQVVRCSAASVIKSTLPGQETVPGFSVAHANVLAELDELLAVVEYAPDGVTTSIANGGLMRVRYIGRLAAQTPGGVAAVGDTVFVNDVGALSLTVGTVRRRVGSAMSAGATFDVWFNGVGGADIDLTPIDRAYLVHGAKGALVNGVRTDGTNADPSTVGFRFASGAVGTTPLTAKGFAGQTANLFEVLSSTNAVLLSVNATGQLVTPVAVSSAVGTQALIAKGFAGQTANLFEVQSSAGAALTVIDKDGDLTFNAAARVIGWPDWTLSEIGATEFRVISGTAGDYLSMQRAGAGVLLMAMSATVGSFVRMTAIAGMAGVGTGNNPLQFTLNSVAEWQIDAGGLLKSLNKDRIGNIDRPAAVADAVGTEYLHEVARAKNYVLNSGFDFWQRGGSFFTGHAAGGNVWSRGWTADRWYGGSVSDNPGDGGTVSVDQFGLANGLSNGDWCARVSYSASAPYDVIAKVALVQEIDRRVVRQLRGKSVNVSAWLRNVGFSSGPGVSVKLVTGTSVTETQTYTDGYTGAATVADTGVEEVFNIGTTFTRFQAGGVVGSTVTTMALVIEIIDLGASSGVTDGSLEVANVMLTESVSTVLPPWQRMESSYAAEFAACAAFYEKSYDVGTVPGTFSTPGMAQLISDASGAALSSIWFKARKYKDPAITFYRYAVSATALWDYGASAGTVTMSAVSVGQNGFIPTPGTAHASTLFFGHWAADAEIF
jgi:hypothetical protein